MNSIRMWWAKQVPWERAFMHAIIVLFLLVVATGGIMVLTGQGRSMEGPQGLRDGACEVCIPLRWWPVVPGHIYAFRDPDNELCLKRANSVDPDGSVFFMGDNQGVDILGNPESIDSRSFGNICRDRILAVRLFSLPRCFDGLTSQGEAQKALAGPPTIDQQLAATGAAINAGAEQRKLLSEQVKGSIQFSSATKQMGDCDLDSVLPLAREQQVSLTSSRPFTKAILWLVGDDIAVVNGQNVGCSSSPVTIALLKPSTVLTIKCVPSAPMAPPGVLVREVVLKK